jgi:hypothetical protein
MARPSAYAAASAAAAVNTCSQKYTDVTGSKGIRPCESGLAMGSKNATILATPL